MTQPAPQSSLCRPVDCSERVQEPDDWATSTGPGLEQRGIDSSWSTVQPLARAPGVGVKALAEAPAGPRVAPGGEGGQPPDERPVKRQGRSGAKRKGEGG